MKQSVLLRKFYESQKRVDTVVFVHGILGHFEKTWGKFPGLLSRDLDLPKLDVLLWGYPTGVFSRHHPLATEGQHLVTTIDTLVDVHDDVILVGHSMGGLIILKGLVDRMMMGHAQSPPCRSVVWITLFASPLNGAWIAGLVRLFVSPLLFFVKTLHKHLRDLSRGPFVDSLMAEVVNRIYRPTVSDSGNRRIPIRVIAATRDRAVDRANREATLSLYRDPAARQLDETHGSVKLPTDTFDLRYQVLAADIQTATTNRFTSLCKLASDLSASPSEREVAREEVNYRYGHIIRSRVRRITTDPTFLIVYERKLFRLVIADGAKSGRPPFDVVNRALIAVQTKRRMLR